MNKSTNLFPYEFFVYYRQKTTILRYTMLSTYNTEIALKVFLTKEERPINNRILNHHIRPPLLPRK